jgi:hypothetical protein
MGDVFGLHAQTTLYQESNRRTFTRKQSTTNYNHGGIAREIISAFH